MIRVIGKAAGILVRVLVAYPMLLLERLSCKVSGHERWLDQQHRRMTQERPPLSDEEFIERATVPLANVAVWLAFREGVAYHCGLPKTAIYPEDDLNTLERMMSPWASIRDAVDGQKREVRCARNIPCVPPVISAVTFDRSTLPLAGEGARD